MNAFKDRDFIKHAFHKQTTLQQKMNQQQNHTQQTGDTKNSVLKQKHSTQTT